MKKFKMCVFTITSMLSIILMPCKVFAMNENSSVSLTVQPSCETEPQSEKEKAVSDLAARLNVSAEDLMEILRVNDDCKLVPLIVDFDEHKNCLIDIFSNSSEDYIKYYLNGNLLPPEQVEQRYYNRSLQRMWESPDVLSITFIIDYKNESVGRIGIGPLKNRGDINCEIGYAIKQDFSGKKITSSCVKAVLEFLKYLLENKPEEYDFNKLRATAKPDNIASNHILNKLGFQKMDDLINDGYGDENEYFYFFEDQDSKINPTTIEDNKIN